jgi:hypothetical protein
LTSGRRPVVKIIAESLSQYDEKHVVLTPLSVGNGQEDEETLSGFVFISKCLNHRLSINRPIKRWKENSPSDGQCQYEKEIKDHLLACQQFLKESHEVTRRANAGA